MSETTGQPDQNKPLEQWTISELKQTYDLLTKYESESKQKKALLLEALEKKAGQIMEGEFRATGKEVGTLTHEIEGIKLKYSAGQKVSWDTAVLKEVAELLPADKREAIIKVDLSIPEKTFKVLSTLLDKESDLYKKLVAARTETPELAKITFA